MFSTVLVARKATKNTPGEGMRADASLLHLTHLDYSYGYDLLMAFGIPFCTGAHIRTTPAVLVARCSRTAVTAWPSTGRASPISETPSPSS